MISRIFYTSFLAAVITIFAGCHSNIQHGTLKKISKPQLKQPEVSEPKTTACGKKLEIIGKIREPKLKKQLTLMIPDNETNRFLNSTSFLVEWSFLGPFTMKNTKDPIQNPFIKNEKELAPPCPAEGFVWEKKSFSNSNPLGRVNIAEVYPGVEKKAIVYAYAEFHSPSALNNVILKTGSTAGIKVWINGILVHTYDKSERDSDIDQDKVSGIELRKGLNSVLVKSEGSKKAWDFYLRFTTGKDLPLNLKHL